MITFRPILPMLRRRVLLPCCGLFALAVAVIAIVHFRAEDLISRDRVWTSSGSFTRGNAPVFISFDKQMSAREREQQNFWESRSASNGVVGALRSPVFEAPRVLECFLAGYPGKPGLELFLERESDHLRIPLAVPGNSYPGEVWRRFYWRLPSSARGQQVSMVAVDSSADAATGWLGVGTPRSFSYAALFHRQLPSTVRFLTYFLINFLLFVVPGFGVACLVAWKWPATLRYPLITVVGSSAFLGYLCFYAFLFSKSGGKLLVWAIYLSSLILIALAIRRSKLGVRGLVKQVAEPLTLAVLTGLCYLCFTFVFINPMATGASYLDGRFFTAQIPGDNIIPMFFAERLYDQKPLRPFCCGGWLSSDRPPLQTGIFLMERPLSPTSNVDLDYQLVATGLQCLWICGVWFVMTSLGVDVVQIRRTLAILIFSGCIFFNTVYTWPKFLTATLILFAAGIIIGLIRSGRVTTYADTVVAAICVGLALVSHPGSLFSLIALPIVLARFRTLFPIRHLALVLPILLAFILPWMAYQKFVDPPGNRLIKLHLAGVGEIDPSTPMEAIRKAYSSHSFSEIVALRWSNIKLLAGHKPFGMYGSFGLQDLTISNGLEIDQAASESSRSEQREAIWDGLGLLNIGWFAGAFFLFKKRSTQKIPYSGWLILIVAVNMLFWCLIEMGPQYTTIVQCSFADFLLLSVGLLGFILELPSFLIFSILTIQLFNLFVVWICSPPYAFNAWAGTNYTVSLQLPLVVFGTFLALLLLFHLFRKARPYTAQETRIQTSARPEMSNVS
jgi:hypothetical protein